MDDGRGVRRRTPLSGLLIASCRVLAGFVSGAVVGFGAALVAIELMVPDDPEVIVWPAQLWAAVLAGISGAAVVAADTRRQS